MQQGEGGMRRKIINGDTICSVGSVDLKINMLRQACLNPVAVKANCYEYRQLHQLT